MRGCCLLGCLLGDCLVVGVPKIGGEFCWGRGWLRVCLLLFPYCVGFHHGIAPNEHLQQSPAVIAYVSPDCTFSNETTRLYYVDSYEVDWPIGLCTIDDFFSMWDDGPDEDGGHGEGGSSSDSSDAGSEESSGEPFHVNECRLGSTPPVPVSGGECFGAITRGWVFVYRSRGGGGGCAERDA